MASPLKLLVVEDDEGLQSQLRWFFEDYEVLKAKDRANALAMVRRHMPPLVLLDLGLPPDAANASEGLTALSEILSASPTSRVIVVTGNDERENALRAVGVGAYDFYEKPVNLETLRLIVDRAANLYQLEEENRELTLRTDSPLAGVITADPQMIKVCRMVDKVAPSNATVLLLGDSGTGKELLARALHDLSPRVDKRFVAINCAAIPENLLESELFGYEKGAFTGAGSQTIGKIEHAHEGTLFLDEIGDLPQSLQAKLLRFLQERTVERLGGRREIPVDIRVICATNQDLQQQIRDGAFREELYYRISEISIRIPPLRERHGDSTLLAHAFLHRFAREQGKPRKGFTPEALTAIESHDWPGNAREMENVIRRAVIMADGCRIGADDLGLDAAEASEEHMLLREARNHAEYQAVVRAMGRADGNIAKAADMLGVTRPTLYSLLDKYALR